MYLYPTATLNFTNYDDNLSNNKYLLKIIISITSLTFNYFAITKHLPKIYNAQAYLPSRQREEHRRANVRKSQVWVDSTEYTGQNSFKKFWVSLASFVLWLYMLGTTRETRSALS